MSFSKKGTRTQKARVPVLTILRTFKWAIRRSSRSTGVIRAADHVAEEAAAHGANGRAACGVAALVANDATQQTTTDGTGSRARLGIRTRGARSHGKGRRQRRRRGCKDEKFDLHNDGGLFHKGIDSHQRLGREG